MSLIGPEEYKMETRENEPTLRGNWLISSASVAAEDWEIF